MLVYNYDPAKEKMMVSATEAKALANNLESELKRLTFAA